MTNVMKTGISRIGIDTTERFIEPGIDLSEHDVIAGAFLPASLPQSEVAPCSIHQPQPG